jgi:O-antigen/teichoic acid export membrane protein
LPTPISKPGCKYGEDGVNATGGISLGRATVLLTLSRAVSYGLALVNSIVLARALGVDRLGAYAYAMGLAGMFALLPNFGINTIVTRAFALHPETGPGVLASALRAQALLAGAVCIAIPAFAAMLPGQPIPLSYVTLAALQLALGTLSWPYLAVLGGYARYDRVALVELAAAIIGTTFLLGAAVLYGGVVAVLVAHVLGAGIAVLVARKAAHPFRGKSEGSPAIGIGALLRQAAPFGAVAAVQSLYTRLDILLLGQMATTVALGLYSVAYKPTNMLVYFGSTVAVALFPLLAQPPRPGTMVPFQRAMRGLGVAGPAMALILSGLAGPLLQSLYGSEYVAAAPIFVVLAWSAAVNWLYAPLGIALQARGQERWWLACLMCALLLNAAGNFLAIPRWGALGAAAATLASEVVLLVLGAVLAGKTLGMLPPLRPVLVGLNASIMGGGALWLLYGGGVWLATFAALIIYGSILVVFRVVYVEDAAMLISWVREVVPKWSHG